MSRSNPLVVEALKGIARPGPAHRAYLNYLMIQALALLVWWPKGGVLEVLEGERGPVTLSALIVVVGMTIAYHAVRAGAEEILWTGQHPVREWALATPLKLGRILRGYLAGNVLQLIFCVCLSGPLLMAAVSVSGAEWGGLAWSLVAVVFQGTFYRLAAAVGYMAVGHYGTTTFFSLRAFLLASYIAAAAFLPAASHIAVTLDLLATTRRPVPLGSGGPPVSACWPFLFVYTLLCVALSGVLYWQLRHQRRLAAAAL